MVVVFSRRATGLNCANGAESIIAIIERRAALSFNNIADVASCRIAPRPLRKLRFVRAHHSPQIAKHTAINRQPTNSGVITARLIMVAVPHAASLRLYSFANFATRQATLMASAHEIGRPNALRCRYSRAARRQIAARSYRWLVMAAVLVGLGGELGRFMRPRLFALGANPHVFKRISVRNMPTRNAVKRRVARDIDQRPRSGGSDL